ncbi:MAG: cobalamin transport system ATP-binding protein [Actinomycetota bacterium]|nr:cobalamin transport system ATP-binding protein [Actinomycetota bacterium]
MTPPLRIRDLTVGYGRRRRPAVVLEHVSADLSAGELACLVGPNGAGKSTLLRSLAGLQPFFAGEVLLRGVPVGRLGRAARARTVAAVLTDRFDAGRLRVCDVVALGRHPHNGWSGRLDGTDRRALDGALELVGATDLAHEPFAQLSDGQRQRVLVARALAQEPAVLLLDEPTAFLDPPARIALLSLLQRICSEQGTAALVCTHDLELATRYSDHLWVTGTDRGLVTGAPEDLAVNGALSAPFAQPGVHLDLRSLTFAPTDRPGPTARVQGRGVRAALAGHALRRAGLRVPGEPDDGVDRATDQGAGVRNGATPLVSVDVDGHGWTSTTATGRTTHHGCLEELVRHVRILLRDPAVRDPAVRDPALGEAPGEEPGPTEGGQA